MSRPLQSLLLHLEAEQKLEDFRREALIRRQLRATRVAPYGLRYVLALNLLRLAFRLSPSLAASRSRV